MALPLEEEPHKLGESSVGWRKAAWKMDGSTPLPFFNELGWGNDSAISSEVWMQPPPRQKQQGREKSGKVKPPLHPSLVKCCPPSSTAACLICGFPASDGK